MLPMDLRLALIGCGPVGVAYAELIATAGSTVLVVFDRDSDAASELARQTGARIAPTLNDAVTAVGVDAVVVSQGGKERAGVIAAATAARRAVFDATPLTAATGPVLDAIEKAGILLGVDLRRRHDVGIRESIDAALNGAIGTIRSCSIVSRDDTMSDEESVIHDLDLARHATGSDIVDVAGIQTQGITMLLLTHVSGAVTTIQNCQEAPLGVEHRIELTGTVGTASSGPATRMGANIATADGEFRRSRPDDAVARSLAAQWDAFVDAVGSVAPSGIGSPGAATLATDIDAALRAGRAARVALAEGRTVGVAELTSSS